MALEKQVISMDLVQGADTKVNDQIDQDFQDMVNVVYDGDMTTKKIKGYERLAIAKFGETPSTIFTRDNELVYGSSGGYYKYNDVEDKLVKINNMNTASVESNESPGHAFSYSANYRCFINNTDLTEYSFYTKEGIFINSVFDQAGDPFVEKRSLKVVNINDIFYIFTVEDASGQLFYTLSKYSLSPFTEKFEKEDIYYETLNTEVHICSDVIADDSYIYVAHYTSVRKGIIKHDMNTNPVSGGSTSGTPVSNVQFHLKDSTHLYISYAVATGVNTCMLKLFKYNKSTGAIDTTSDIISRLASGSGAEYRFPIFVTYPLTDTTAVNISFNYFFFSSVFGIRQNYPLGGIFKQGDRYCIPIIAYFDNNISSLVMNIVKEFTNSYYMQEPLGISDSGAIFAGKVLKNYTINNPILNNNLEISNVNYFTTVTPENNPTMVKFNCYDRLNTTCLEVEKVAYISGGVPSIYDGRCLSEHGFIGNPFLVNVGSTTGGSLPADTGYSIVALYFTRDAQGNEIYSQLSQPYSGGDPVNGLTLPVDSKLVITLQASLITMKNWFNVEIYIRRKNKLYQLAYSENRDSENGEYLNSIGTYGFTVEIEKYPAPTAKIMPYQDGSIPVESVSNTSFSALYADRLFRFSKDNPNSISYSHKKLRGQTFEFNDSVLYLDILDKNGINEERLTGAIAMDGRLIIFKESSILYIAGTGPSRANTQDDLSEPQLIATDVGCTDARSIVLTPDGVMFKSNKGIYLLNRKLETGYIGSSVERFNDKSITGTTLQENTNEVRFGLESSDILLIYNYLSRAWSWATNIGAASTCMYKGNHTVITSSFRVLVQSGSDYKNDGNPVIQKISSPWLKLNKVQGYQKAYEVLIIGTYKTPHRLSMKVYYDYELYSNENYIVEPLEGNKYGIVTKPSNASLEDGTAINGVYQMRIDLVRKNCQAVRVVIEDVPLDVSTNTGECFALSNITVTIGVKKGVAKIQASKSY